MSVKIPEIPVVALVLQFVCFGGSALTTSDSPHFQVHWRLFFFISSSKFLLICNISCDDVQLFSYFTLTEEIRSLRTFLEILLSVHHVTS